MRVWNNIFCRFAVLMMAVAGVLSCMNEKDAPLVQPRKASVVLNVSAGESPVLKSSMSLTRTESTINTLRIYAFTDGTKVGHYYKGSVESNNILMDIGMLNVDSQTGKQTIKFYIIANEQSMSLDETTAMLDEGTTEEQLDNFRFIAMNEGAGLPMFYCDTVMLNMRSFRQSQGFAVPDREHLGHQTLARQLSFELKRPVGKITFMAAKKSSSTPDVFIKSVSLLARGTRHYNYLMPQEESFLKTLEPRLNDRPLLPDNSNYRLTAVESTGHEELASIYCSEIPFGSQYWNEPNDANSAVLRVEYSMGEGAALRTIYIYLPPIARNGWVRVKCTISGQGHISVRYTVEDWNYVINSDEDSDGEEDYIVFDYPTHKYILPYLPTQSNPNPDPDPVGGPAIDPVMSVGQPFSGYFQILYPEGQKWSPTVMRVDQSDAEVSDFMVNVYEVDNYGRESDITNANNTYGLNQGPDTYFRIEIVPLEAKNTGAKVHLGITAEIQGFGHAEYLLINGSQAENFWPLTGGTDPNILIITQVEEIQ